jgi:hypothetical protein
MVAPNLSHEHFMELAKLYNQLTQPSEQSQYRARKHGERTVKEIQQAVKEVKEAAETVRPTIAPAEAPVETVFDLVRKIEKEQQQ